MIKLVASDLDGTLLLNGAQKLPEKIFPLIRELKKWEFFLWLPVEDNIQI